MMTMHKWKTGKLRRAMKARLARATGRDRQRLIDGLGCSLEELRRGPYQMTRDGIAEYAKDQSRAIRHVAVFDACARFTIDMDVRLHWWAWIGLGLWHRHVRRRLEGTRDLWCPAGIVATVVVR